MERFAWNIQLDGGKSSKQTWPMPIGGIKWLKK
jgi:hypothetical protein